MITTALATAAVAGPATKGVDLELISEIASIEAGKPFRVGLAIHHHDKYHTYWQNPGIVGVPTSLVWSLPEGFSAGPIQWPVPEIVDMAGHPAHGYERDVLLMLEITPPAKISKASINFEAKAAWMACAEACHPGHATLSLTLPAGNPTHPDPKISRRFEDATKALPKELKGWTSTASFDDGDGQITLQLIPEKPSPAVATAYFFSSDGQVSSDQSQEVTPLPDGGFEVRLQRSEFGPSKSDSLSGVLCFSTSDGHETVGTIAPSIAPTTVPSKP